MSLKSDDSDFVQNYFGVGLIFCGKKNCSDDYRKLLKTAYFKITATSLSMTTLAGGFLVTNYHDGGRNVSKSSLDRGRKQKRPSRQTAVDNWHG